MTITTWSSVDFVTFLGLEKTLTPLEIEDLTNGLNREAIYRALKIHREPVPTEIMIVTANEVKREFIVSYLKEIDGLDDLVKPLIADLSKDSPDFEMAKKQIEKIHELLPNRPRNLSGHGT